MDLFNENNKQPYTNIQIIDGTFPLLAYKWHSLKRREREKREEWKSKNMLIRTV